MREYVYHVLSGSQHDDCNTSDDIVFRSLDDAKNFKPDFTPFPSQFDKVKWVDYTPGEYHHMVAAKYLHPIDSAKPADYWNCQTWLIINRLEVR